jgi:hypothetical protein
VLEVIYRLGDVNTNSTMSCFQLLTNEAGLADHIRRQIFELLILVT